MAMKILVFGLLMFVGEAFAVDAKVVAYGKYLVEDVAKCQECHTPKMENGDLDRSKWLKGAVLDFAPLRPVKDWHKTSPDLTSNSRLWAKWGEATFLKFMQTGLTPKGTPAAPPMPAYKLNAKDAEAVLEYLKSLK